MEFWYFKGLHICGTWYIMRANVKDSY